jgi:hypothetical protein
MARVRGDGGGGQFRVEIEGARVDVDEHRGRTDVGDGLGGGDEGEWRSDHFVARAEPGGAQGQVQGIGPRGNADGVLDTEIISHLALERLPVRTEDEVAGVEHPGNRPVDLVLELLILNLQVNHRDLHGFLPFVRNREE